MVHSQQYFNSATVTFRFRWYR